MDGRERFTHSKCSRCGRATGPARMGDWDLYTLGDYPGPLKDLGDFCLRCCQRYTIIQWLVWFDQHAHQYTWYKPEEYADPSPFNAELL